MGTAEAVYNPSMGLIWAVMPITATLCFIVGKISFLYCSVRTAMISFILDRKDKLFIATPGAPPGWNAYYTERKKDNFIILSAISTH